MIKPNNSFPVFTIGNLSETKMFYTSHFGFTVAFENEWYLHLISESGIQIGFLLPNQPTQPEIFHQTYNGKGVIFSLEVEDADAAYSQAEKKSLNIVLTLRSEDWGQRHFCVEDPNGIHLDIVQTIKPSDEYESGYATN